MLCLIKEALAIKNEHLLHEAIRLMHPFSLKQFINFPTAPFCRKVTQNNCWQLFKRRTWA